MRPIIFTALMLAVALPVVPVLADPPSWSHAGGNGNGNGNGHGNKHQDARKAPSIDYRRYDYNRPDPRYGDYRPDRYYVADSRYSARRLSSGDRIYRGTDNRYYCRRSDGTTGLIIGGIGGGVLGSIIAPGGSKTLGTILGAGAGALIGSSIDRDNITCR
jgi:hypothetical protein